MIELNAISKDFPDPDGGVIPVLANVTLSFPKNSITALFGPNGSGKSTLMSIIANLTPPSSGTITIGEPGSRIAYVFQDYRNSLLPWRTVRSNILLPCAWSGDSEEAADRLDNLLSTFSVKLPLDRHPNEISGGQAQLACLLRALVVKPKILILDEPTSALDYNVQWETILQLQRFWSDQQITIILVSHDPDQAILLADRIVIMRASPGQVAAVVENDLPRPRTVEAMATVSFLETKRRVLKHFMEAGTTIRK